MIRRFAILLLSLSAIQCSAAESNLRATSTTRPNYAASHQRRELSWWSNLLGLLHPTGGVSGSSGGSGGGGGGSDGSGGDNDDGSSSGSYNGNGGGSGNGGGDNDASNGSGNGGSDDNTANMSNNNNNGGGGGDDTYNGSDDDGDAYLTGDDDRWQSSNLDNGGTKGSMKVGGIDAPNVWPFIAGALVAGVIGAVLVVGRRRQEEEEENHPLEDSFKKRMKLFSGAVFRKNKKGALNDEIANGDGAPAFIEISTIRSGRSMGGGGDNDAASIKSSSSRRSNKAGSYKAPASPVEQPVIFENESGESEL